MRKLTQEEIARRLGVSQSRVSAIEAALLSTLQLKTIQAYVEALGGALGAEVKFADGVIKRL